MKRPGTLFQRTARTLALGLLIFQLVSVGALLIYLMVPLAQRSADDLADLLVLSARVWIELPADRRASFAAALRQNFGLSLTPSEPDQRQASSRYPYIRFLRQALLARLPGQNPHLLEAGHERFQVAFKVGGQAIQFRFAKHRITPRPGWAVAWMVSSGAIATLILAWLLARRIAAPVAELARAARRIAKAGQVTPLPVDGDAEFVELARIFNETARQLQLQRDNQTTLLAGVSHDLRTPLARMKMALGLLAEEYPSPLLAGIERDITEMNQLISAQLALARAQEAETEIRIDLVALLTDLVEAAQAQAPGRLQLKINIRDGWLRTAPMSLRRCLGNLLDNALRYGGTGDIQMVCRRLCGRLLIGVRDSGPGIPAQSAEAVFRPFYRLEASRSRDTGGSGLGLAITRQLCQTQGWRVAIKRRYGGGASVWLLIADQRSAERSVFVEWGRH